MLRAIFWLVSKNLVNDLTAPCFPNNQQRSLPNHNYVTSSYSSSGYESDLSNDDTPKKSVLYDLVTNGDVWDQLTPYTLWCLPPSSLPRVFPVVGAFSVQCDFCTKWRFILAKKKYEEIREHIIQNPFVCDKAREW